MNSPGKVEVDVADLWILIDHIAGLKKSRLTGTKLMERINDIIEEVIRLINN